MDSKESGYFAEDYAVKLLVKKGYRIIAKNFYTHFSEIDIIAIDADVLVFVEVKARWGTKFGKPEESVNSRKIEKIRRGGEMFSIKNPDLPKKMRIEVVALLFEKDKLISGKIIKVY